MSKKKHTQRICLICRKAIGGKENYIRLTEYNEGNEIDTGWYHRVCFKDRFMQFDKLQKQASTLLGSYEGMLNNLRSKGV